MGSKEVLMIEVIHGDCLQYIPLLRPCNLIFADPPFNIGEQYDVCLDTLSRVNYWKWCGQWIQTCWDQLTDEGILILHGNDELAHIYLDYSRYFKMSRISWNFWHYRFGVCTRSNWITTHAHCMIFAKGNDWTWNPDDVLVESDRVQYGDMRILDSENGGKRLPGTVWGIPSDGPNWGRVQGNNAERRPLHPNQLPEKYLERLIRAYTNPDDWILDPFGGSGTTAVVAQALERNCITIDISEAYCESIQERLKEGAKRC